MQNGRCLRLRRSARRGRESVVRQVRLGAFYFNHSPSLRGVQRKIDEQNGRHKGDHKQETRRIQQRAKEVPPGVQKLRGRKGELRGEGPFEKCDLLFACRARSVPVGGPRINILRPSWNQGSCREWRVREAIMLGPILAAAPPSADIAGALRPIEMARWRLPARRMRRAPNTTHLYQRLCATRGNCGCNRCDDCCC